MNLPIQIRLFCCLHILVLVGLVGSNSVSIPAKTFNAIDSIQYDADTQTNKQDYLHGVEYQKTSSCSDPGVLRPHYTRCQHYNLESKQKFVDSDKYANVEVVRTSKKAINIP